MWQKPSHILKQDLQKASTSELVLKKVNRKILLKILDNFKFRYKQTQSVRLQKVRSNTTNLPNEQKMK